MSNYDYQSAPRGNPHRNQDIPDYDASESSGSQRASAHIGHQHKNVGHQYKPQNPGAYYVEDYSNNQPLAPPRSHYARPAQRQHEQQQQQEQQYQQPYEPQASYHGSGQWTDNGYALPGAPFRAPKDLQSLINQLQKRAPLGPPPSARRGPSSYYEQEIPDVHPIVEETDSMRGSVKSRQSIHRHHGSVPQVTADDSSSIYSGVPSMPPPPRQAARPDAPLPVPVVTRTDSPVHSLNDLVRNAGLGLSSARSTLATAKSFDRLDQDGMEGSRTPNKKREFPVTEVGERERLRTPPATRSPSRSPQPQLYSRSHAASSDALGAQSMHSLDASESDMDAKSAKYLTAKKKSKSKSPLVPTNIQDGAVTRDKAVAASPGTPTSGPFRDGKKRPPHLNLIAAHEAESRGSLTSLPDLIQRATKLASNLDRGKTASRLGLSAWLRDSKDFNEKLKMNNMEPTSNVRNSAGTLNDMMAAFPSPALGTPPRSTNGSERSEKRSMEKQKRSTRVWTKSLGESQLLASDSDLGKGQRDKKRRCCGMPVWLLTLLVIIGICIVAAAIVIPVVLVVIPEQRAAMVVANTTAICQSNYGCQNGGSSVLLPSGACQCICINGFTGPACGDQDKTGCQTVSVGTVSNVTLGSAIPRLLADARKNYSIPLDSSNLLALFSSASLSCNTENALVTFNGLSRRQEKRQDGGTTTASAAAATSQGIVFADGYPTTATTSATSTTSSTSAASASTTLTSNNSPSTSTNGSTALDFARTVVLFMFQTTGQLNSAVAAQQNFQRFFSSGSGSLQTAGSIGLGSGYTADLTAFKVTLANGTTVGGLN